MSFIEQSTVSGIRCDVKNCVTEVTGPPMGWFDGPKHYEQLAASQGWTFWVGRTRRAFCPGHGPSRGHRMWQDKPVGSSR